MATPSDLAVDARCEISGKAGTIRFVGITSFAPGKWVGVELDDPLGKNNGYVDGKHYFDCKQKHGVFARASQVKPLNTTKPLEDQNSKGFAPPNENTNIGAARNGLRSPASGSIPTLNRTTSIPSPLRLNKGPQQNGQGILNSPSTDKFNRGPTSPTFSRRPRGSSDASNVDMKKFDPSEAFNDLGEVDEIEERNIFAETPGETPTNEIRKTNESSKIDEVVNSVDPFSLQETPVIREQSVPLKDYEELRLKLKILENKRTEDREKIRELEKYKSEAEQFMIIKPKLQSKMLEMQQEIRDLRKQLKDAVSEKEIFENKYNETVESMEFIALDKEMAEEKAENLQHEVDLLKEKVEEISVDLNVFKNEGDMVNQSSCNGDSSRPSVEIIQLEKHNDRLKEALVRLRDVSSENEVDLNKKIKNLEKELVSLQDIQVQYDQTRNQLKQAELHIEDLKAQLDDAMNSTEMLEELTEKNLLSGEKIEEQRMLIEDLEALKELNDELEESHIENEKQLQAEIDHKDILIREYKKRIESAELTNADYENTINQFRELVATLQSDLEQFRQKETQSSESKNLSSQSQEMLSLNIQLQSTVLKAQAKQIDLELRRLDATQASEHLDIVQPYLPETYFETENDSIRCLLLLKRLVFKSELIIKQVEQIHNIPEKLNTTVPEKLISVCELRQKLGWFSDLSRRFVSFISGCPVETFLKMGQVYHDLVGTERRIHVIVDLLRKEELKESERIVDVQRSIAQLEHLAEIYLSNSKVDEADRFYAFSRSLDFNADTIAVTLGHAKQAVALACKDEEINVADDAERFNAEFFQPLQGLVSTARSSKVIARKLLRRLDELGGKSLIMKSELLPQFKMCNSLSTKLVVYCNEKDSKDKLELSGLRQIIYRITDKHLNISETNMWEGCAKSSQEFCLEITSLVNLTNDPDQSITSEKEEAPWVSRATALKKEVQANAETERKLQQANKEICELIKENKIKEQSLQEGNVKIEFLEKRMEVVKKQADTINSLEQELANSKKHETDFVEVMESLQQEIESLEQQNKQFANNLELKLDGEGLSSENQGRSRNDEDELEKDGVGSMSDSNSLEIQRYTSQIESLKFAVRYLRAENSHLKGKDAMSVLNWHLQPYRNRTAKNQSDGELLKTEFRIVSASPRIIDLSKSPENRKQWQPLKSTPGYQYQVQQSVMYTLQQRSIELQSKLKQIGSPTKPKNLNLKNTGVEQKSSLVGRIRLPLLDHSDHEHSHSHNVRLKNSSDFEKIHTIFVN
ncbi:11587_t:CDS:10 [Diversispora eburnea]|uniref:11587_t:CDS:1 n=1 Tax=Diversispora eburnea TaxID=1213867 RepID=A0A9N9AJR6_9GLOM|nr:11587_t:CDS:10 [Diversispora eburnea]